MRRAIVGEPRALPRCSNDAKNLGCAPCGASSSSASWQSAAWRQRAPARASAARDDGTGQHARDLRSGEPALPAITTARSAAAAIATRPRVPFSQLPPAVLATPPALRGEVHVSALDTARIPLLDPSIALALRSARGPPA